MNIIEALDAALPDLPARNAQRRPLKLDPRVIAGEHTERGQSFWLVKTPGSDYFLRLTPEQWKLLQLFDGTRNYGDVAEMSAPETGVRYTEDDVKEFATYLYDKTDLFYKTPVEKSGSLKHAVSASRKRSRFSIKDVADITLHRWPYADRYLTRIYPYVKWIYTRWFVGLTLLMFAAMLWMWADRFHEVWTDSFAYYNFTEKSFWDLFEFWCLFGCLAFFHETAHGMTCKHFGGNVEKMEFILMYFAPTFVCDVTQVWVLGGRLARLATVIAGIWIDLVLCFLATVVWWATTTGMPVHDFAYKVMMISGIGVTLLNLNPLIKLDGYYMFIELVHEEDLKERATAYVASWISHEVFRLPGEIEFVPRRRRVFYIIYAILSGIYGYLLLTVVAVFAYHVVRRYTPEWAFIPALLLGGAIFRKPIKRAVKFMKMVYLDKKERIAAWLTPRRVVGLAAILLGVLLVPIWPEFVHARFVVEPAHRETVRAAVPGTVERVMVHEGQVVAAGEPILQLANLDLEEAAAGATAEAQSASARAINAGLRYSGFGPAEQARLEAVKREQLAMSRASALRVVAPIRGTILTGRMSDLLGSHLNEGELIAEIGDFSSAVGRVYVPEFEMRNLRVGARVTLKPAGYFGTMDARVSAIAPASGSVPPALVEAGQLRGIRLPQFYLVTVPLNYAGLRDGLTGDAKIYVTRRSLGEFAFRFIRDSVDRRLW